MSKTWYPVIDYVTCRECGVCIDKCPHDIVAGKGSILWGILFLNVLPMIPN